jgi:hypothetical protein
LINRVDIYAAVAGQDADGGPTWTYPAVPTRRQVACSVQAGSVEEVVDEQQRVTQERQYGVMFAAATLVQPRDKMVYVDSSGVSHILFARVERDEAGRGAAFVVRAIERV